MLLRLLLVSLALTLFASPMHGAESSRGSVVAETLTSTLLTENRIGLRPNRDIRVYLPPGYAHSGKAYPVVYLLHNVFRNPAQVFEDGNLQLLVERGFAAGVVKEFILVVADYSGPTTGSMYENSPVSGRWLDYTVNEVLPFIDRRFRTLRSRESRAVIGEYFGGRGALQFAMSHAKEFSVAYALHPVATGAGDLPWTALALDWPKMYASQSFAELNDTGLTQFFFSIHQAFSPNTARAPCFCDFFMTLENGNATPDAGVMRRMQKVFMLDGTLDESADALRTMRGLALDWGRFDTIQAHVLANRAFSRLLEDLGIEHEAEEYRGDPWSRTWTPDGRFYSRVLPFLSKHLVF
jgi:hypothetical protein